MYLTDLLAVHLRDICYWEGMIIKTMLDLQCGAEFSKFIIEEIRSGVRHVAIPDILLRSTEIIHEVIPEGGWHCVHKPAD